MTWYFVNPSTDKKKNYIKSAYLEMNNKNLVDMKEEESHKLIDERHPEFQSGQYIQEIKKQEWDVESCSCSSKKAFMKELGRVAELKTDDAYSISYGRLSIRDCMWVSR